MDFYPQDLLVGVFPLVFAVNTLPAGDEALATAGGGGGSPRRSLFDRFLNAVAASLVEEPPAPEPGAAEPRHNNLSLFRADDDESSDEEDFEFFAASHGGAAAAVQRKKIASVATISTGFYAGFGRRGATNQHGGHDASSNSPLHAARGSYAKALQNGQGFFQRARIVAVSTQHGLPPCKDPDGSDNLASSLGPFLKNRDPKLGKLLVDSYPLAGILTAGWLEKHVHALPSVILVVCSVCANQREQDATDRRLLEAVANFEVSLVPKRQCIVHVVGLMTDDVTLLQGEEWTRSISNRLMDEEIGGREWFRIALLRASSDLGASDSGAPASRALRELHQSVRDASLQYYLAQARRNKDKLANLTLDKRRRGSEPVPTVLLPLIIRYCFKIAIFYEFQWKHEKSLLYMAEAYRHTAKYYEYLLHLNEIPEPQKQRGEGSAHSISIAGDELEVSLNNGTDVSLDALWNQVVPRSPDDMIHQCRAIAEWLNLKLLHAGFSSHTEGGLLAADSQWRQHCRLFCTRRHPALFESNNWFERDYIARNWLTLSELVERHPPKALGDLGNEYDEVILRCSPWRAYGSAAEAALHLWRDIANEGHNGEHTPAFDNAEDPMRTRYVGGFGSEGLLPILSDLSKSDHRAKALELALRSIRLYETECEKEKRGFYAEDHATERSTSRAGVRLYYVAGSILLGLSRHKEAAEYLEKATKYAFGWPGLQLAIRRMLIECYEKHMPSSNAVNEESNHALVSMILDSYFNANMSTQSLRRALHHFASMTNGGGSLKWFRESEDEEDRSLPFSFAVSFPDRTHAIAGDNVNASVLITSNLDYAVHVNSAVLLSLAGELEIPSLDLLSAQNASEGNEGGIIIQSKASIIISTTVELPKDTSSIAIDDSGNGGEIQGVAGKGSFAKSARPRSAGVTSAGGARLVAEDDDFIRSRVSQGWSLRFLGGKPFRCDGIRLVFYPVQAEKAVGGESMTMIELTLRKKKPRTSANIKRTPFEEDNYIASAWSRPMHLPLSSGPRSLRVLGPQPELTVKDITESATGGKAVEGIVNRIILKLTAGANERCKDIKCRISCFNVLITPAGTTLRLVPESELIAEGEGSADMNNPDLRTPCLVLSTSDGKSVAPACAFGNSLPDEWALAESGTAFTAPQISSLASSESSFVELNLFRPAPNLRSGDDNDIIIGEASVCKTDFYVNISYQKERPQKVSSKRLDMRTASRRRAKPVMSRSHETGHVSQSSEIPDHEGPDQGNEYNSDEELRFEEVTLEYTGSVVWCPPLSASFRPLSSECGSGSVYEIRGATDEAPDDHGLFVADGDIVTTRCLFEPYDENSDMSTEILSIQVLGNETENSEVSLMIDQEHANPSGVVYRSDLRDPRRCLSTGCRRSIAYSVKASLKPSTEKPSTTTLGSVIVEWKPSLVPLPDEAAPHFRDRGIHAHGPLRLASPSRLCIPGPRCCIGKPILNVHWLPLPSAPQANAPFDIELVVSNSSATPQVIRVQLSGSALEAPPAAGPGRLLCSGMTSGEMSLAPQEAIVLSYTLVVPGSGAVRLPGVDILSGRHQSRLLSVAEREIYVLPSVATGAVETQTVVAG